MKVAAKRLAQLVLGLLLLACTTPNNSGGCGGPVFIAPPVTQDACTIQITLNKADAGYTSDVYLDGTNPDLLIADSKNHVGAIARRYFDGLSTLRFYIHVMPNVSSVSSSSFFWGFFSYDTSYNVYSDSYWAQRTIVSDTADIIAFEDVPDYWSSDRDYNDVVIAVEDVNCDNDVPPVDPGEPGVIPPPSDPPPPPDPGDVEDPPVTPPPAEGVIVIPAGGIAKVHANFLQATFKVGDLYLAGDPPELLIAKGSNKQGSSARNFFYEGEGLIFFMRVDGVDFFSTDTSVARLDNISENNYRIYFDVNGDGDFNDVIVHIVLQPTD